MTQLEMTLTGAQVLRPDGVDDNALSIGGGVIQRDPVGRSVDLRGYIVLPGLIDVHGDGFERHVAPRRGAMKLVDDGLRAAEAEFAANGITTATLAQFWSWEGGLRGPEFAAGIMQAVKRVRQSCVTDLRAQLRFETHMLDDYAALPELLKEWGVSYVVFNDHLAHDRLAAGRRPPRLTGQALKAGRNPDDHHALMVGLHMRRAEVPAALDALCETLLAQGVALGSHDDQSAADRADWRARGVRVSEFPETLDAAEAARAGGDFIVMGAPNVVRGGSHNGNASAVEFVAMGLCDALASDYHYPSLMRAALMLETSGVCSLSQAWRLVSDGPASLMGLTDRGRLEPGLRADLVVLDAETRRVAATMSGGRISYLSGDIAGRFLGA